MLMVRLSRSFRSTPVKCGQVCPTSPPSRRRSQTNRPRSLEGVANNPTLQWPIIGPLAAAIVSRTFLSPAIGAHPSVVAAASPTVKAEKEKYEKGFLTQPAGTLGDVLAPQCNDEKLADEVSATLEALLKQWDISV